MACPSWAILGSRPPSRRAAGATLVSFVAALTHFVIEMLIFKTMSIKGAASPMIIACALLRTSARQPHCQLYEPRPASAAPGQLPAGSRCTASRGRFQLPVRSCGPGRAARHVAARRQAAPATVAWPSLPCMQPGDAWPCALPLQPCPRSGWAPASTTTPNTARPRRPRRTRGARVAGLQSTPASSCQRCASSSQSEARGKGPPCGCLVALACPSSPQRCPPRRNGQAAASDKKDS